MECGGREGGREGCCVWRLQTSAGSQSLSRKSVTSKPVNSQNTNLSLVSGNTS